MNPIPCKPYSSPCRCGFRLIGYKGAHDFYCKDEATLNDWMLKLHKVCILFNFSSRYSFGKLLGKGSFARVHFAERKKDGAKFAVKSIEKTKVLTDSRSMDSMLAELAVLRRVNHPNIIKLFEIYENDVYVHMVIEYLEGGELFQCLKTKGLYSEKDAALAIKRVLEALKYCHALNIVHRDLKPENLILSYSQQNLYI